MADLKSKVSLKILNLADYNSCSDLFKLSKDIEIYEILDIL